MQELKRVGTALILTMSLLFAGCEKEEATTEEEGGALAKIHFYHMVDEEPLNRNQFYCISPLNDTLVCEILITLSVM